MIKSARKPLVFNDESFDFQLMRTIASSVYGMADINECLVTARNIQEGNVESWYHAWNAMAERVHDIAEQCLKENHTVSALSAFLRASNYYRASEFYLHGNPQDPRIRSLSAKSRACFAKATTLAPTTITPIKIPYENTTLPGYFYRVDNQQRPTLIIQSGFDGTQEELYGQALEGVKRGYHVLTFEGPGQGAVLREQQLPFRPDWEVVIQAITDFAVTQTEIDASMLILFGLSFGGHLAPRGASGNDRIKILIANTGIYDWLEGIANKSGLSKDELLQKARDNHSAFDHAVQEVMNMKTEIRWAFEHGMLSFQATSPSDLMEKYAKYTLQNRASLITSTTLILDSEQELAPMQGQARRLFDHLACPKTFMYFTAAEGAGLHCQVGAFQLSSQRIFDWLDTQIKESS